MGYTWTTRVLISVLFSFTRPLWVIPFDRGVWRLWFELIHSRCGRIFGLLLGHSVLSYYYIFVDLVMKVKDVKIKRYVLLSQNISKRKFISPSLDQMVQQIVWVQESQSWQCWPMLMNKLSHFYEEWNTVNYRCFVIKSFDWINDDLMTFHGVHTFEQKKLRISQTK